MISIQENKGFQLKFLNGWTVSVQIGKYNYHDNYKLASLDYTNSVPTPNAEVAAWDKDGNWYYNRDDNEDSDVKGWQSPAEILEFMNVIAAMEE